ncbi:MAG: motility protein A [Candidatus Latescibacterota bacterium]|nr:MAG: motility protein A [Candidatus Latescibacteria bacterium 4484_107]RKY72777.1 MAG: motility protein A [Candidatus Latescibacterota bacterium]
MDIATIAGAFAGIGLIVLAILQNDGSLVIFMDSSSAMIVLGGTIAATLINFPLASVMGVISVIKKTILHKEMDPGIVISTMVEFAEVARKEGILSLEQKVDDLNDDFAKTGIRLAVDGTEPEAIQEIMELELENLEERHRQGQKILVSMGTSAPAFGMIGTLIGLVKMLMNMNDPSSIGPAMSVALLTTFYGAFIANLLFIPLAGKLKTRSEAEVLIKRLILEGIMAIQSGENPRMVEQKLGVFIAPRKRKSKYES